MINVMGVNPCGCHPSWSCGPELYKKTKHKQAGQTKTQPCSMFSAPVPSYLQVPVVTLFSDHLCVSVGYINPVLPRLFLGSVSSQQQKLVAENRCCHGPNQVTFMTCIVLLEEGGVLGRSGLNELLWEFGS